MDIFGLQKPKRPANVRPLRRIVLDEVDNGWIVSFDADRVYGETTNKNYIAANIDEAAAVAVRLVDGKEVV